MPNWITSDSPLLAFLLSQMSRNVYWSPTLPKHLMFWDSSSLLSSWWRSFYICGSWKWTGMNDPVPQLIKAVWLQWKQSSNISLKNTSPVVTSPKKLSFSFVVFSDSSENIYAGVIYLHLTDSDRSIHISFVIAKAKLPSSTWHSLFRGLWCPPTRSTS